VIVRDKNKEFPFWLVLLVFSFLFLRAMARLIEMIGDFNRGTLSIEDFACSSVVLLGPWVIFISAFLIHAVQARVYRFKVHKKGNVLMAQRRREREREEAEVREREKERERILARQDWHQNDEDE
jgi:hypothetical protein